MRSRQTTKLPTFCTTLAILFFGQTANGTFTDVAESAGVWVYPDIPVETNPPQGIDRNVTGYPICLADLDRDGWTDVLTCPTPERLQVFMNNRDGTFREEGVVRGFGNAIDIAGIAAGDFTNSGKTDIFLVPRIGSRYYLYENDGNGIFHDRAIERGADMTVTGEPHKGQSVGLVDFDRDGYLDIHVTEWGVSGSSQSPKYSVLLRNRGSEAPGHFTNVTESSGLTQPVFGPSINGFSSAWADFDEDGNPDLSLINDYGKSQFWWNNGDGTFTEDRAGASVGTDGNGMGVAVADVDRDGLLDFFVSSFDDLPGGVLISANRLYRNLGNRKFEDVAGRYNVTNSSWGWGSVFFDPDNDGFLDLLVTNGYPYGHNPNNPTPTNYISDARSDVTRFFLNSGTSMSEAGQLWNVVDKGLSRSAAVFDYDNDGDEDVLIGNLRDSAAPFRPWILYRNDSSDSHNWLRLQFTGVFSNRDGYGTVVKVTTGGDSQTAVYAPTNAYIGQREPYLHFGLGQHQRVDRMEVKWPNGAVQEFTNVEVNQLLSIVEPGVTTNIPPAFLSVPETQTVLKDAEVILSVEASGTPSPHFSWYKNGEPIEGAIGAEYRIRHIQPFDAGVYTVRATNAVGSIETEPITLEVTADLATRSIARWWNEALLDGIRKDTPDPPVHARNLYHFSSILWDTYWAYSDEGWFSATPAYHQENLSSSDKGIDPAASQQKAISYAAYRMIKTRFANSPGREKTYAGIDWLMAQLGYDPSIQTTEGNSPEAVGNRIAQAVLNATLHDGANELNNYADTTDYVSVNEPMIVGLTGTEMNDPNRWQQLSLSFLITQNGIVQTSGLQEFVGVNARNVTPFALQKTSDITIAYDPGPQPLLGGEGHDQLVQEVVDVIRHSSVLDPADGIQIDISPGALFNNPLGTNSGTGYPVNPVTGSTYEPNVVAQADYGRILAEFWADGPDSETPPGHWNVLFNEVSAHPQLVRRYRGGGPELSKLEWDVKGYLALNGALHDAACAAWTVKRQYDSSRPISLIRYMGGLGQSSDPLGENYHEHGLPLIEDLIEMTTLESVSIGGRHEQIVEQRSAVHDHVGKIVVRSWLGNPSSNPNQVGGVGWILSEDWTPYQKNTFVTPAFPGYISGHSTFSRAAAEVMSLITGNPYFPGGLATYTFPKESFLHFEKGPSETLTLQWATYFDAADQAGYSRLFGGIHVAADDFVGRILGSAIGRDAFNKATSMR